jgi:predicted transcriptional regulator of viral defense system
VTAHHSLAVVARVVPKGVVCLLSALAYHDLGTQLPHEVWLAIGATARRPARSPARLRVVRMSGPPLTSGVEVHNIEGVPVRIFNAAKTVADCFRFRNKIGLDVAIEALRAYRRRGDLDALWRYAEICRVARVIRPYLEAIT